MDANDDNKGRKRKSRENTQEERRKQRKEWKKRKQQAKRAKSSSSTNARNDGSEERKVAIEEQKRTLVDTKKKSKFLKNSPKVHASKSKSLTKEIKPKGQLAAANSRSALMLSLAQKPYDAPSNRPPQHMPASSRRNLGAVKKHIVLKEKSLIKELEPGHIDYLPLDAVGSGSYGQCYRARYRGIDVVVKKMIHRDTEEDKLRAKREVVHEAEVLTALGDHDGLPMLIGITTANTPFCVLTQCHGVNERSVTLHQAAKNKIITPTECVHLFVKICSALEHVHWKGFLHNDIKSNNVVLDQTVSEQYAPVLIDFGKSTRIRSAATITVNERKTHEKSAHVKSYLAPEVVKCRQYSPASDIYSMGRMLKAIATTMGFYDKVRVVVKTATNDEPSHRANIQEFAKEIAAVQF
ncbi:unnamed protein product [Porites lobata]|uniref:Protein kinase domain-containing protein n=1 Tax=Porites lobata TaxID=104759 RepID=A0ABN8NUP4_9CNID|nr:unnamed protein product [Porites lobata]